MQAAQHTAMILAAGLGTRMRPLTNNRPKPLVQVAGKALIDWALDLLREAKIDSAVVNTHYLAQQMREHIANIQDMTLVESAEPQLLETGGGVMQALPFLHDEQFFVLNSDTICLSGPQPVLQRMQAHWDAAQMDMLLLLMPTQQAVGYDGAGDFCLENGRMRRRHADESHAPYVFTGLQLLKPCLFKDAPQGAFSMNQIYNQHQGEDGWFQRIGFLVHDGDWLHVGDPEARQQAEAFIALRTVG